MPAISRKTLIAKFRALGYDGPFSGGKHQFMIKGAKKNPHGSGDIDVALVKEILRQAEIGFEEWDKARKRASLPPRFQEDKSSTADN